MTGGLFSRHLLPQRLQSKALSLESEDLNTEMRNMKEEIVKLTAALLEKDKSLTTLQDEVRRGRDELKGE